jgi:hypothetical protein
MGAASGAELRSLVGHESARVACLERSNWPLCANYPPGCRRAAVAEPSWGRRAENGAGCTKQQAQQPTRCCNAHGHVTPTGAASLQSCCSGRRPMGARVGRERRLLSATAPLYTHEADAKPGENRALTVCSVDDAPESMSARHARWLRSPKTPGLGLMACEAAPGELQ